MAILWATLYNIGLLMVGSWMAKNAAGKAFNDLGFIQYQHGNTGLQMGLLVFSLGTISFGVLTAQMVKKRKTFAALWPKVASGTSFAIFLLFWLFLFLEFS